MILCDQKPYSKTKETYSKKLEAWKIKEYLINFAAASQWTKSPKNSLKEFVFVNLALKIQCRQNTLIQTAFSVILPTGLAQCKNYRIIHREK